VKSEEIEASLPTRLDDKPENTPSSVRTLRLVQ